MVSNTTNTVDGRPQPGTLLLLDQPLAVRSIPLGEVKAGETIKALSEVEVTNDLVTRDASGVNHYHDVAAYLTLVIATTPTATTGIEVAEEQGNYVTPQMHHWTLEASGSFTASQSLPGRYLNLVMRSHSADPVSACWTFHRSSLPDPQQPRACGMDVDHGRGHLSAFRTGTPSAATAGATPFSVQAFSGSSLPEASPGDAPITYGNDPAQVIVALARPVGALRTGDVLSAHSELQVDARNTVRSNADCNVMVATRLYLSPSPNSLVGSRPIGNEAGYNFTGQEQRRIRTLERGVVPSSTTFKLDRDYATPQYVVLRAWTKGNSACALYGNGIRVAFDQPASFMQVTRYRPEQVANLVADTSNSGDASERVTRLDAVSGTATTVYSRELTELAPGELLEALGEVELNSSYHRAEVHTTLVLADSPSATTGIRLAADNYTEMNPYMRSLPIHDAAAWVVPAGTGDHKYLNMVVRATRLETLGLATDDFVQIGPDDGRLVVQRFHRPRTAVPRITDSDPNSPSRDSNPELKGTSEPGSTVRLYQSAGCTGAIEAQGPATTFATPGLSASVASDSVAVFTATATDPLGNVSRCSAPFTYTEDSTPPAAPSAMTSSPVSPANDNSPELRGSAEAGSTVGIYRAGTIAGCSTASLVATGASTGFSSPGLNVSVFNDSVTTLRATAADAAGNVSPCSSSSVTYTEDSIPPPPPAITSTDPTTPSNSSRTPRAIGTASSDTTAVRLFPAGGCAGPATSGTKTSFQGTGVQVTVAANATTVLTAKAVDSAGNVSACSSGFSYTHDDIPPAAPSVTGTTPSSPSFEIRPSLRGNSGPDVATVRVHAQADCLGTPTSGSKASFDRTGIQVTVASNATTTLSAAAFDAAGNWSGCSNDLAYVHDSIPPQAPTSLVTTPASPSNENGLEVSGEAEAATSVRLYRAPTSSECTAANLVASGSAASFGSTGLTASVPENSTTAFRATATDAAGNVSDCSAAVTYTEDSTPPGAPSALSSSPASPGNDNSPELRGSAEAGSSVRLYRAPTSSECTAANLVASSSAAFFGSTGLTASVPENSTTAFRATATDAAGNVSGCSAAVSYREDSLAPAAPELTGTDPGSPANDNSPALRGSAEVGSMVKLYAGSDCSGTTVSSGEASLLSGSGLEAPVSDDSSTTFWATATDAAGNASDCSSSSVNYTEDSTGPEQPAITDLAPDSPANDNSPQLRGSATPGSTVRVYLSPDCSGRVEAAGTAASFAIPGLTVELANNVVTSFTVDATDAVGNASQCSGEVSYVEDSAAPEARILSGPRRQVRRRLVRFTFAPGERGAVSECKLDREPFHPCLSPQRYRKLKLGKHVFKVRSIDVAGNFQSTPTVRRFRVLRPLQRRP